MADLDKESTDNTTSPGSAAAKHAAGAMAKEVYLDQKSTAQTDLVLKKNGTKSVDAKTDSDTGLSAQARDTTSVLRSSAEQNTLAAKVELTPNKNSVDLAKVLVPFDQSSDGVSLTFQANKLSLQAKDSNTLEKLPKDFSNESSGSIKQRLGGGTKDYSTASDNLTKTQEHQSSGNDLQILQTKDFGGTTSKDNSFNAALRDGPPKDSFNVATKDVATPKEFLNTTIKDAAISKEFSNVETKDNSVFLQKERFGGGTKDFSVSAESGGSINDNSVAISKQRYGGGIKDFSGGETKDPSSVTDAKENWGGMKEPISSPKFLENPSAKPTMPLQDDGKLYSRQVEMNDPARVSSMEGRSVADLGKSLSTTDKQNYAVQVDRNTQALSDSGSMQSRIDPKLNTTDYKASSINQILNAGSLQNTEGIHTLESRHEVSPLNANPNRSDSPNAFREDLRSNDLVGHLQTDPIIKDKTSNGSVFDSSFNKVAGTDQSLTDRIAKGGYSSDQLKTPIDSGLKNNLSGGEAGLMTHERDSNVPRDSGQTKIEAPPAAVGESIVRRNDTPSPASLPEGSRSDAPHVETQRADGTHQDSQKIDSPRADVPHSDAARSDAPRSDAPRSDAPHSDAPRGEAPRSDAPRSDAPRSDAPHSDAPHSDAPHSDAPHSDAPRNAAPRSDAPRNDAALNEAARIEHANIDTRSEAARAAQGQASRVEPIKAEFTKAEPTAGTLQLKGEVVVQRVATAGEAIALKTTGGDQAAHVAALAANDAGKASVKIEAATPISDRGISSLNQALGRDSQITLSTKAIADFSSIAKVSAELGIAAGRVTSPLTPLTSPLASSLNAPLSTLTSPISTNLSASIASAINSPLSTALTSAIAGSESAGARGLQPDVRTTSSIDAAAILGAAGKAPLSVVSSAVRGDINIVAGKPGSMNPAGTINGGIGGLKVGEVGGRTFINGRPLIDSSNDRRYLTGAEIGLLIAAVGIAKARMDGRNDKADPKGEKGGLDIERGLRQFSLADGLRRFPGRELTLSALLALTGASKVRDMDLMLGIKTNNERSLRIERTIGSIKKEKIEMILPEFTIPKEEPTDNKDEPVKTDNPLLGLLPAAQNLLRLRKKETDDKEKVSESETPEVSATSKLPVLRFRRIYQVVDGDTLVSIAESKLRDANLGWLIADINKDRLTERKVDGKRVVEACIGEKLQLPLAHEIAAFYKRKDRDADPDNLITIVVESEFDKDRIERNLNEVLGVARGAI